jgi:hypothetical protein
MLWESAFSLPWKDGSESEWAGERSHAMFILLTHEIKEWPNAVGNATHNNNKPQKEQVSKSESSGSCSALKTKWEGRSHQARTPKGRDKKRWIDAGAQVNDN